MSKPIVIEEFLFEELITDRKDLLTERDALKAEVEDLRKYPPAGTIAKLCNKINNLKSRNAELVAELRRLQSAVGEVDFDIIEKLLASE